MPYEFISNAKIHQVTFGEPIVYVRCDTNLTGPEAARQLHLSTPIFGFMSDHDVTSAVAFCCVFLLLILLITVHEHGARRPVNKSSTHRVTEAYSVSNALA